MRAVSPKITHAHFDTHHKASKSEERAQITGRKYAAVKRYIPVSSIL